MTLVLKVDSICSTFTKLYLVAFGATPALLKRHVNPLFPSKAYKKKYLLNHIYTSTYTIKVEVSKVINKSEIFFDDCLTTVTVFYVLLITTLRVAAHCLVMSVTQLYGV